MFGAGQSASSGDLQSGVLATHINTVGMVYPCIKSSIQFFFFNQTTASVLSAFLVATDMCKRDRLEYMEKSARLKAKVKAALVYPVAVMLIAGTITSGLLYFIVPKFKKMFTEMLAGEPLPALTRWVIGASEVLQHHAGKAVLVLIVVGILFVMLKRTKPGSYAIDLILYKTPPFNSLVVKSSVAKFCSTLGTLMQSGVSVLNALQIVRDTSGNQVVATAVQTVHDAVKEGEGMTKPLEETKVFPGMVVSMIEVGEETGALPEMLSRVAKVYEEEVDMAVEGLTSLIEPIMIVVLGVLIGGIVLAMFMPLIKLIEQLG
ncbi:hypothetical protein BVY04_00440 [bacterium M21]|nr:hypothetical protein BVY04_00440 [bacterium M21]